MLAYTPNFSGIIEALKEIISNNKQTKTESQLIKGINKKWRDDFSGTSLSNANWQIVQTGAGQSISVSNSELKINAGTTANSETIIRSVASFTIPFKVQFIATLSQRIINQVFKLRVANSSGSDSASILLQNTNNTFISVDATNAGSSAGQLFIGGNPLSSSYVIFEIDLSIDEINFFTRLPENTNGRYSGITKHRQIPDPNFEYFIELIITNSATAPASNTILTIDSVSVQDIEELTAEISGGRAGGGANLAIPVGVINPNLNVLIGSGGNLVQTVASTNYYTETTTPIAANATFTGTGKDAVQKLSVVVSIVTDQNVTCYVDESIDNTIWDAPPSGISCSPGTTKTTVILGKRYYRVRIVAGATAPTILKVTSANYI